MNITVIVLWLKLLLLIYLKKRLYILLNLAKTLIRGNLTNDQPSLEKSEDR